MSETTTAPTVTVWTYDDHTPGYLPDSDDRPLFTDRADAVTALVSDLREWADVSACDVCDRDEDGSGDGCLDCDDVVATVGAILTDDGPAAPGYGDGWSCSVDYGRSLPRTWDLYRVTLPVSDLTDDQRDALDL